MSKMSSLILDVQELLEQNYNPLQIAGYFNIPVHWVYEIEDSLNETYNDDDYDQEIF